MRVILGGVLQSTPDGSSIKTNWSMTDPVPTCSVSLVDNTSSLFPRPMQELLILDDQAIPNPTVNMLLNPDMNPYNTNWFSNGPVTGITLSQAPGGGVTWTFNNAASSASLTQFQPLPLGAYTPGETYTVSFNAVGASAVNVQIIAYIAFVDQGNNVISTPSATFAVPATATRLSFSAVAPAGASFGQVLFFVQATSSTNSGSVTITQAQLEPNWLPTMTYPSPFCGPSQTNCRQLPAGYWIRQYRKFAGFVNHITYGNYHGNVRTVQIDAVGYAWLLSTVYCNNSYTNQYDSAIITNLLSTYLPDMFNTSNVVQGVQLSSVQSNWDDLRTIFDTLASQSTFYLTVDYYWNLIYAPPGYISMPVSLICDNSSNPDLVTTFPAYGFSAENDYTQPGSSVLVLGNGTNVAKVIDPNTTAQNGITTGWYTFQTGNVFQRKVTEDSLNSVADCTQRGIAELLQYDYSRWIYHLTTNVELIPGESIAVTSATDNLNQKILLIQQVQARWLGTNETMTDVWEYQADLGATNRAATNILSRIFRVTTRGTSAPAINAATFALIETIGLTDTFSTGTPATTYQATVLGDAPIGYWRMNEQTGTMTFDYSGNAHNGTINGGVTLYQTGLTTQSDAHSMLFNGSSGYINLPTTFEPTGANPWSVEAWIRTSTLPTSSNGSIAGFGTQANGQMAQLKLHFISTGNVTLMLSTYNGDIQSNAIAINTTYHVVGTYDGTSTRLYVNGSLVAGPTAFSLNVALAFAGIGATTTSTPTEYYNGQIAEVAFYNYALSATQISNHYYVGTH
jgi:hypothetical protein